MSDFENDTKRSQSRIALRRNLRRVCALLLAAVVVFSATEPGRKLWKSLSIASGFSVKTTAPLNIHVIDVGKADAILIECEGHAALLDAGTALSGDTVVDYIARCHIDDLDYVIASHPDNDHIGGMAQVLSEIPVNKFVRSHYNANGYTGLDAVIHERAISECTVSAGDRLSLGGAEIFILGPLRAYDDTNNASLVFKLEYRGFSALFCGDIEGEAEADLVKCYKDISAELLKVPHHGSKTSCSKDFLTAVSPKYAVVSVGRDNNKLPTEKILKRLDEICLDVYRTDTDGTVVFEYNGDDISAIMENR